MRLSFLDMLIFSIGFMIDSEGFSIFLGWNGFRVYWKGEKPQLPTGPKP